MVEARLIRVADDSGVGEARRAAARMAAELGLDEPVAGRLAIVVNELARNVVVHARAGELALRALDGAPAAAATGGPSGVEVLALDKGPGIADVGRALADGFSTAGTAGTGLGAARRQSQQFEVWSEPGQGTAVVARVFAAAAPPPSVGAVCVARQGEPISGDGWTVERRGGRTLALVADGLGHGPDAAVASRAAIRALRAARADEPAALLHEIHEALRGTRGAAVSLALVDADAGELRFAGLGNVAGFVVEDDHATGLASTYGTAGAEWRKPIEQRLPLPKGALLLLASDGVRPKWQLADYPGLARRDPALVAGVLYRDFAVGRDDATVVALRASMAAGGGA